MTLLSPRLHSCPPLLVSHVAVLKRRTKCGQDVVGTKEIMVSHEFLLRERKVPVEPREGRGGRDHGSASTTREILMIPRHSK